MLRNVLSTNLSKFGAESWQILRLGIPLMVAHMAMVGLEVIDTMMAGQVSAEDLAGLALGVSIWLVIELFMGGWISAMTPRIARFLGANRFDDIRLDTQQAMIMALLIGSVAMLLIWWLVPYLDLLGATPAVTKIAQNYLSIIAWGMPASGVIWVMLCLCEGYSDIRFSMGSSLFVLALNAGLNWVFVFGHFGFPAMGAVGCAWTTVVVYWVWLAIGVGYIQWRPYLRKLEIFSHWPGLILERWRGILLLGLPISLSLLAEEGFFSVASLSIAPLGTQPLGAHQITMQIVVMVLMLSLGIGQATAIRMAGSLGSGDIAKTQQQVITGLLNAVIYSLLLGALIFLIPGAVVSLFTQDAKLAEVSVGILVFMPIYLLSDSIQLSSAQILRGFEDTKVPMLIQVFAYWAIGFPLAYSLGATEFWGQAYGVFGFWLGFYAGISISAVLLGLRLRNTLKLLQRGELVLS